MLLISWGRKKVFLGGRKNFQREDMRGLQDALFLENCEPENSRENLNWGRVGRLVFCMFSFLQTCGAQRFD